MKVRIVESVLKYAKTLGGKWMVVERDNVLGLENGAGTLRIREPMNEEQVGQSWDVD